MHIFAHSNTSIPMRNFTATFLAYICISLPVFSFAQSAQFIENLGQVHDQDGNPRTDVHFLLPLPGMNLQLRKGGFSYDTYIRENPQAQLGKNKYGKRHFHRVDIEFEGGKKVADFELVGTGPGVEHYYNAVSGDEGAKGVRHCQKVVYREVYPKIDVEFVVGEKGAEQVEYNFILHPGAKLSDIRLRYRGPRQISLQEGSLWMELEGGKLEESIPKSYFEASGEELAVEYEMLEKAEDSWMLGLRGEVNEIEKKMIVDPAPTLDWGSYYGGTMDDEINAIATDANGNVLMWGTTESPATIATNGAFQTTLAGQPSAFLAKMDSNGLRQWATYYGTGMTEGFGLTVDAQGKATVAGLTTGTANMATPGAWQAALAGNSDAFLARFDAAGLREWATYFGGTGQDAGRGVEVDAAGHVYLAGATESLAGIATSGSHQPQRDSLDEGFLAKFSPGGQLRWATYYGGPGDDRFNDLALAPNGDPLLVGSTTSASRIATSGSHQVAYNGNEDGFLVRFDSSGNRLFGTFFGDGGTEGIEAVACDAQGNALVAGFTSSATGIATSGAWQPNLAPPGTGDAFLAKFSPTGQRVWGTYFGQANFDGAFALDADAVGNTYLAGFTTSASGLASSGAFQVSSGGLDDAFVAHFDAAGQRVWSTYFGGDMSDAATDIVVNGLGQVFVAGKTASGNGFATFGAHQTALGGSEDGWIARLGTCATPDSVQVSAMPLLPCAGDTVSLQVSGNLGAATQWVWYADSCGGGALGVGASLLVQADAARDYFVRGEGGCVLEVLCVPISVVPQVVDTSITLLANGISANASGASLQWLDCNSGLAVPGETSATFFPSMVGSYAVEVLQNGCRDTSACYVFAQVGLAAGLSECRVFPNPTSGNLKIELGGWSRPDLRVYNGIGQLVAKDSAIEDGHRFSLPDRAGVYLIVLSSDKESRTFKISKR